MKLNVEKFKGNIDKGIYTDASNKGLSTSLWFEDFMVNECEMEPTPYKGMSRLEVEIYRRKLASLNQPIPKTAYEIAVEDVFGIKAFGARTDRVEKFFITPGAQVLFPEFMANRVYFGKLQASIIKDFIANVVVIDGFDFKKIYLEDTERSRQTSRTARGAEAPSKRIKVGKQTISLEKYMLELEFEYEVIYDTPLNLYSVVLQRVGQQIGIDESDDLIDTLLNGDGNSNGLEADQTQETEEATKIEKKDIIKLADALPEPYSLDRFVGRKSYMIDFWDALSDMTNPAAQWGQTGMKLPIGIEWDRDILTSGLFLGVDSKLGVSYVTNDTVLMTETDRIINKQTVNTVFSKRGKFSVIDQDAIGALDIEH